MDGDTVSMRPQAVIHDRTSVERRDAIESVWRDQGTKLFRSLVAFTGDQEVAADAMAEAFAQLLGAGSRIEAPDRWVWRTAFRVASGELKNRTHLAPLDASDALTSMPEPVADLVRALRTLSSQQRAVVVLHLYADLSSRDVARILGCTQATVRVHLSQARRRLRPLLEDHDG